MAGLARILKQTGQMIIEDEDSIVTWAWDYVKNKAYIKCEVKKLKGK